MSVVANFFSTGIQRFVVNAFNILTLYCIYLFNCTLVVEHCMCIILILFILKYNCTNTCTWCYMWVWCKSGVKYSWSGYKSTKGMVHNGTVLKLILASISLNKYDISSHTQKSLLYIDVEHCQKSF